MRLLLTAVNCPKGALEWNARRSTRLLQQGSREGCDLVLLPEMSLTGYASNAAIGLDDVAVGELVRLTESGPAVCFGFVEKAETAEAPYITQVVARAGGIVAHHRKASLGEGEDADFCVGAPASPFRVGGVLASLAVCAEIGSSSPYRLGSTLVLAPSAPGLYGERCVLDADWRSGWEWWRSSVLDDAGRLLQPGQYLAVSTQAGATSDEDFPGWAALIGIGGVVVELPDWREGTLVVDLPQ